MLGTRMAKVASWIWCGPRCFHGWSPLESHLCHKVPPATTARQRLCRWLSEECVRVTSLRSPGHRTSYPLWTADCFCVFCLLLHLFALCLLFKLLLDNRVTPDNCLLCCLADQVETGSAVTWKYPSCVLKAAQTPLFRSMFVTSFRSPWFGSVWWVSARATDPLASSTPWLWPIITSRPVSTGNCQWNRVHRSWKSNRT